MVLVRLTVARLAKKIGPIPRLSPKPL